MEDHRFFLELVAILVSARLCAAAAVKMRVPAVIGELVAGVALGPTLLGWFEPGQVLKLLAEIGVTLLLFEVGLETDIARLVRTGSKALIVAVAGLFLPLSLGFALAYWGFDTSLLVALVIGGTFTATSTGITARVLFELGRQRSAEAQIVIGAAVVDDVLGVLVLVLIHRFATEGVVSWTDTAQIFIFLVGFFALAPFIAHPVTWIIRRLEQMGRIPGLVPTVTFALVFFFAWLATLVGAPAILGGLAAGLSLSRRFFLPIGVIPRVDREFAHKIEAQMKPIIHLFTPFFFVVVGMTLDLSLVRWGEPFIWVFSASVFIVALLGKFIGPLLISASWPSRLMIGAAMVPRGEVGLIFAELGRSAGVFTDDIYAGLVFVIALTTLLPLFFIQWLHVRLPVNETILYGADATAPAGAQRD
jgi:Kef-type K+ transport system membrane component KefB